MTMSNVAKGKQFQSTVKRVLEARFGEPFEAEIALPIGEPPKFHAFDLVSRSRRVACECKAVTWTVSGNVPSAKITSLREAATYLSLLGPEVHRILAVQSSLHIVRGESLAGYFTRLNRHLLGRIEIMEVDEAGYFTVLRERDPPKGQSNLEEH